MPFKSKAQMRAAFAGALGDEMKSKAETWASETPDPKHLPEHVSAKAAGSGSKSKSKKHALAVRIASRS